jgi:hypothetical protein
MMGRQTGDQGQLFYLFNLERRIPAGHLLRRINPVVTRILVELREGLMPFYSDIGRPYCDRLIFEFARKGGHTQPWRRKLKCRTCRWRDGG